LKLKGEEAYAEAEDDFVANGYEEDTSTIPDIRQKGAEAVEKIETELKQKSEQIVQDFEAQAARYKPMLEMQAKKLVVQAKATTLKIIKLCVTLGPEIAMDIVAKAKEFKEMFESIGKEIDSLVNEKGKGFIESCKTSVETVVTELKDSGVAFFEDSKAGIEKLIGDAKARFETLVSSVEGDVMGLVNGIVEMADSVARNAEERFTALYRNSRAAIEDLILTAEGNIKAFIERCETLIEEEIERAKQLGLKLLNEIKDKLVEELKKHLERWMNQLRARYGKKLDASQAKMVEAESAIDAGIARIDELRGQSGDPIEVINQLRREIVPAMHGPTVGLPKCLEQLKGDVFTAAKGEFDAAVEYLEAEARRIAMELLPPDEARLQYEALKTESLDRLKQAGRAMVNTVLQEHKIELQEAQRAFNDIERRISGAVQTLVDMAQPSLDPEKLLNDLMAEFVPRLQAMGEEVLGNLLTCYADQVQQTGFGDLGPAVSQIQTLLENNPVTKVAFGHVKNGLARALKGDIQGAVGEMEAGVKAGVDAAKGEVHKLKEEAQGKLEELKGEVANKAGHMRDQLEGGVKKVQEQAQGLLSDGMNEVKVKAAGAVKPAVDAALAVTDDFRQQMDEAKAAAQKFGDVATQAQKGMGAVQSAAAEKAGDAVKAAQEEAGKMADAAGGMQEAINEAAGDMSAQLEAAPKAVKEAGETAKKGLEEAKAARNPDAAKEAGGAEGGDEAAPEAPDEAAEGGDEAAPEVPEEAAEGGDEAAPEVPEGEAGE
ncbi:MAG: hypothetical protein KC613_24665, partial [Myxococcales bacterium]|nr:hypothetical protein [Myxococcales bacterium]